MDNTDKIVHLVIPPLEAQKAVKRAGRVYLRECSCRAREQKCPRDTWQVCLLFEHAPQDRLHDARLTSVDNALSVLKTTAARGVIYRLFFKETSHQVTELCSCCDCCCSPHCELKQEANYREQLRSQYVAVTDAALCAGCGLCQDSCFFQARRLEDGALHFADERCFGCGRCVEYCPEGAIRLEQQAGRGMPIPHAQMEV